MKSVTEENTPTRRQVMKVEEVLLLAIVILLQSLASYSQGETKRFAIIGDFGSGDNNARDVANLVKSWNPDFIITVGDNNYPDGEAATIDKNIGQFYHEFIFPYVGNYGAGATVNRFFPCLGNHDWDNTVGPPAQPHKDYFTLPNNERYYDFVQGPVHLFCVDSDSREPDGITKTSVQANWLRTKLAASTAPWKIVYMHHQPYSTRASYTKLQWPFQQWGASAVLSGHAHVYERVMKSGFPYIINGLGGESTGSFPTPIDGSVVTFGSDYGAQLVTANDDSITFQFITRAGIVIDTFTIGTMDLTAPTSLMASPVSASQIDLSWTETAINENGFKIERCEGPGCSNFVEVATVNTNVMSFSDVGLNGATTYVYRVRAFNTSQNSAYSNTAQATTATPGSVVFGDDFDDGVRNASIWKIGVLSRTSSNFNPLVQVSEEDGSLKISPLSSVISKAYSGYVSELAWNFANNSARVEVTQKAPGNTVTIFAVGNDKDNWYRFRAKGTKLYLEDRYQASTAYSSIIYNSSSHRFWRIRHDPAGDTIIFETSSDGSGWVARRTVPRQISIAAVRAELSAGTDESISDPGFALFDNFSFEGNSAPASTLNNFEVNAISSSTVNLNWADNSTNVEGFKIDRCHDAGCLNFSEVTQVGPQTTKFTDSGLTGETTYRYRIRTMHRGAAPTYSGVLTTTTATRRPEAPSNVEAKGYSSSQINLRWSVNSANEDGFKIERCENAGCTDFVEIARVGMDVDNFSDTGLPSELTFAYRIRAYNSGGDSPYSTIAQGATQSPLPPAPPDGLAAKAISSTRIDLTWSDKSANAKGFSIERCLGDGCVDFKEIAQTGTNVTVFSDVKVSAGTTYRYQVRAFNGSGHSGYSNIVQLVSVDLGLREFLAQLFRTEFAFWK